jgi:eukaryotic-like serine/threonine-protein kinase
VKGIKPAIEIMKYSYILLLTTFTLFMASCDKTISDDSPLPIDYKASTLVPTDLGILYSFNAETGQKIWEFNTKSKLNSTPVMDKAEVVYFGAENGYLYAVDAKTGKEKWKYLLKGYNGSSPCFGDDGFIYIGADSLYCIKTDGSRNWAKSLEAAFVNITTAPTFKDGKIFVTCNAKMYCIDAITTATTWTYNATAGAFLSGPTVRDGKVYAGMNNGMVKAVDQITGNIVWSYTCKEDVYSTPMVRGDMCIVGSYDDTIRCIDAFAGTDAIRWKIPTAERISSSATIDVDRETVYIGSNDFNLYAINHVTGKIRWKFPTGSIIRSSPTLYNNKIYFTSFDKYLYCVDVNNGKLVWKVNINAVNQGLLSPIINGTNGTSFYPTISGNSIH